MDDPLLSTFVPDRMTSLKDRMVRTRSFAPINPTMRKLAVPMMLSILVSISLMLGLLMPSLILLRFHVQRAEIVRTQCVQRAKPVSENTCQGRCHLRKKLAESKRSSGEQQAPPRFGVSDWQGVMPVATRLPLPTALPLRFAGVDLAVLQGHPALADPVPWA